MKPIPAPESTPFLAQSNRSNRLFRPLPVKLFIRVGAFLILAGLFGSGLYSASSASPAKGGASKQNSAVTNEAARPVSYSKGAVSGVSPSSPLPGYRPLLAPVFSGPPTVETFAGDCSTRKTVFDLQDADKTVCAHVSGGLSVWLLVWSNANSVAVQTNPVSPVTQDVTFTLSPSSSLGDWRVILFEPFGGTVQIVTPFTVVDSGNPVADLAVANSAVNQETTAGSQAIFTLQVTNYGPSPASNVQVTADVPANTTFVSFTQLTGPVFDCSSHPAAGSTGTTTCTIASLDKGATATFLATYLVDGGTAAGTEISSSASISSVSTTAPADPPNPPNNTPDNNSDNDTSVASASVAASPCVLTCPDNITADADSGQAGAVITYNTPSSTGNCGSQVSCSVPSGSFFPAGTTTVVCAGDTGDACTFQVTVNNPGALSISLNGANPISVECGLRFTDPGAIAVDGTGQSVPVTVTLPQGFNPDAPATGSYTLTYTATQGANSTSTTRAVNVTDTTPPQIKVDGANPYKIEQGTCLAFVDPGVSADDSCAGTEPVTRSISGPGGLTSIDPNTPGTYTVTYTASDGSHTATATRTVLVGHFPPDEEDLGTATAPPVVKLLGGDGETHTVTAECGTFVDPGATATTACGGPLSYTVTGTVDSHTPGNYSLTYTATDGSLSTSVTRVVVISADATAPVITLNGTSPMTVECHTAFADPGAVAHDACAGDFAATASSGVDPNTVGTYTVVYSATDPSGHAAAPVSRTVNVVDTTAPTITLNGANPMTVECHTGFADPGATASDGCAGNLTSAIVVSGSVNPNVVAGYTLTYTVSDGHNTTTQTRTVNVVDTTPPTISCPANISTSLPAHSTATSVSLDPGAATGQDSCSGSVTITATRSDSQALTAPYPAGLTTITWRATDPSGNYSECPQTIQVSYIFTGFFSPVGNLPILNVVNAGRAIPVKFSLSGNKGLSIFAANSPQIGVIPCDASAPAVDLTDTVTAGGSSLSYDAGSDQYNYVWKTDSSWAGTCRQLQVRLNDGNVHVANFKFK